jgi:hypothetical protein
VVEPIVATLVALLVQVPPPASVSVVVEAAHTLVAPEIADGIGLMVTIAVDWQPDPRE